MAHPDWRFDTLAVHGGHQPDDLTRAVSQPIIPAVAYAFPDTDTAAEVVAGQREGTYYGRYGNPTTQTLERKMAELEGGEECIGLSSGMAAISPHCWRIYRQEIMFWSLRMYMAALIILLR